MLLLLSFCPIIFAKINECLEGYFVDFTNDFSYNISKTSKNPSHFQFQIIPNGKPSPNWTIAYGNYTNENEILVSFEINETKKPQIIKGKIYSNCSRINWSKNGERWDKPDYTLEKIHIVTMTHLDVGFTDGFRNVCDTYFDKFFPQAGTYVFCCLKKSQP